MTKKHNELHSKVIKAKVESAIINNQACPWVLPDMENKLKSPPSLSATIKVLNKALQRLLHFLGRFPAIRSLTACAQTIAQLLILWPDCVLCIHNVSPINDRSDTLHTHKYASRPQRAGRMEISHEAKHQRQYV